MANSEHGNDSRDYKCGWLQNEGWDWDEADKAIKRLAALTKEKMKQLEDDSSLPFECAICKRPFTIPVVTACKHYFCKHCARKQHVNNKKCFECGKPTKGLFRAAINLQIKMTKEEKVNISKRMFDEDEDSKANVWNLWKASKKQRVDEDEQDKNICSGRVVLNL